MQTKIFVGDQEVTGKFVGEVFKVGEKFRVSQTLVSCGECLSQPCFEGEIDYKKHWDTTHGTPYVKGVHVAGRCKICSPTDLGTDHIFPTSSHCARHYYHAHRHKRFQCKDCGAQFFCRKTLNGHQIKCSDSREYYVCYSATEMP